MYPFGYCIYVNNIIMVGVEVSGVGYHLHRYLPPIPQAEMCYRGRCCGCLYAEEEKRKKYTHLSHSYSFQPVTLETSGSVNVGVDSMAFLKDLGHCMKVAKGQAQSFAFLIQRPAVAVQAEDVCYFSAGHPQFL